MRGGRRSDRGSLTGRLRRSLQATSSDFVSTGEGTAALSLELLLGTEWYNPQNAALFEYFNSWEDLVAKLGATDYDARGARIRQWAERHTRSTLNRWRLIDRFLVQDGPDF